MLGKVLFSRDCRAMLVHLLWVNVNVASAMAALHMHNIRMLSRFERRSQEDILWNLS